MTTTSAELICGRCDQVIEDGELYHRAFKRGQDDSNANFQAITGSVAVHDFPCPTRFEVRDGRVIMNGADIGPESMYSPSHPALVSAAVKDALEASVSRYGDQ